MAKNTRRYARSEEKDTNETIQKLKAQIRNLKKQNKELISENQTLLEAWAKTEAFLSEVTKDVPIEEMLKYEKLPKKATRKKDKTVEDTKEQTRKKWANWRKENL